MEIDNDFLGRAPRWTTRWGIYIISIFFVFLLVSSFFITFNDVLVGEVEITTTTPPEIVKSPRDGQITEILINPDAFVEIGDAVAVLNSSANYNDISSVKLAAEKGILIDSLDNNLADKFLILGTVQNKYSEYQKSYKNLVTFNTLKRSIKEFDLISKQLISKKSSLNRLAQRLKTAGRNKDLNQSNHERMITLHQKGVISKAELDKSEMELLESVQESNIAAQQYTEIAGDVSGVENRAAGSNFDGVEQLQELINQVEISKQELLNAINNWEQENLLISHSKGYLSLMDIWSQYQNVKKGEEVFSILPKDKSSLIGLSKLPIDKTGKVKVGQKVIIKLYNFPYEEWGSLEGKITYLSQIPKKGDFLYHTAYLEVDSLSTSFGKRIEFRRSLIGQCEIILEPASVFDRVIFNSRKLFSRTVNDDK